MPEVSKEAVGLDDAVQSLVKSIEEIRGQLCSGQFEFSRHAFRRTVERNISEYEIREVGKDAILIEDYPDDKYSLSCLLLGFTSAGRPLHLQVSVIDAELVKIITIYEPDPIQWIDYSRRR
ncbi:DUF4258 domain-containing protein [Leptolyngbya sp. FACHB-261]|uniref:DUF4258 domain-containing protein n=1 Tax=Leptolyngbya sp. FACHB-261 TaxID=2692806 RepID=UPI001683A164|nr:DUF4258 domain-containing protein [Leptolyngbya sp. FACHB-261]MBD2104532.1 DUF4258 domain-containing protein [Leptolyngbya sp. FACHB-261]